MLWTKPLQNVPDVREYKLVRFQRHTKKDNKGLQWASQRQRVKSCTFHMLQGNYLFYCSASSRQESLVI